MGDRWIISRRRFLSASALAGVSFLPLGIACRRRQRPLPARRLRFGIVSDVHYADTDPAHNRYFRQSLAKMGECIELMNEKGVAFLVELGDFKDQNPGHNPDQTLSYLDAIEAAFQEGHGKRFHVLGNHDVDSLSKTQFAAHTENSEVTSERAYYSFDIGGYHFVVLDANFRGDGADYDRGNFSVYDTNIPDHELAWLQADLSSTERRSLVFTHQPFDCDERFSVNNAAAVRAILERSGKVIAVFQGHIHAGGYAQRGAIHYVTMRAMVDGAGPANSAYATVDLLADDSIVMTGYRRAISRAWPTV